jgi:hypothetical protein
LLNGYWLYERKDVGAVRLPVRMDMTETVMSFPVRNS